MNNQDYNLKEDVFKWLEAYGLKQGDEKMHWPSIKFFHKEVDELMDAISDSDEPGMLLEIVDVQWQVYNMEYYGISLDQIKAALDGYLFGVVYKYLPSYMVDKPILKKRIALQAVSEANWSKICKTESEATHSVYLYKEGRHPQKMGHKIETYWEKVGDYYVVKTPEGKGMKSYLSRNPRDIYNELLAKHMEDGANI